MTSIFREIIVVAALTGLFAAAPQAARAAPDYTNDLALAISAAPDPEAVASVVATYELVFGLAPEQVAQAFGEAASLCNLGRCANPQAVFFAFTAYKQGKDEVVLDTAFAVGQAGADIENATATAEVNQSSIVTLASPGEPPSGQ